MGGGIPVDNVQWFGCFLVGRYELSMFCFRQHMMLNQNCLKWRESESRKIWKKQKHRFDTFLRNWPYLWSIEKTSFVLSVPIFSFLFLKLYNTGYGLETMSNIINDCAACKLLDMICQLLFLLIWILPMIRELETLEVLLIQELPDQIDSITPVIISMSISQISHMVNC